MVVAAFVATSLSAQTFWGYAQEDACDYKTGKRFCSAASQGIAIKMPREKVALLKGKQITSIKAMFSTGSNISNARLFISAAPGGAPLYEQAVTIRPKFNNYELNQAYTVTGESDLYIGFTFDYASDLVNVFSVDGQDDLPEGFVWAVTDEGWKAVKSGGSPALFVGFNEMPSFTDIIAKPIRLNAFYKAGGTYDFTGQLFNAGTETITSLDLSVTVGENAPELRHLEGLSVLPGSNYDFALTDCTVSESGTLPICINVTAVNGGSDAAPSDNLSQEFKYVYPSEVEKRILLEEFTGLGCSNCPAGAAVIERVLNGRKMQYAVVAHHTYGMPNGQDYFSMMEDNEYKWFFNGKQYAPAIMANRLPYVSTLDNPVVQANIEPEVRKIVEAAEAQPPYVDVDLVPYLDRETRQLEVTVTVKTYELPPLADNRLNVYLSQDGVAAGKLYAQSGAGSNYVHNYIFRGSLTGVWGEPIELKRGETVTRTFTFEMPEEIVSTFSYPENHSLPAPLEDMKVTAFVEGVTNQPARCPIYNMKQSAFVYDRTAIDQVVGDEGFDFSVNGNQITASRGVTMMEAFTPQGTLAARGRYSLRLPSGLYIIKARTDSGKYFTRKVSL